MAELVILQLLEQVVMPTIKHALYHAQEMDNIL
jgi:hypothetical protein